MDALQSADFYYKVVFYLAIGASVIFVIQSLATFFGGDLHDGAHADFDGDLSGHGSGLQMLTFRNLINFLLGFSWTAIALHPYLKNQVLLSLIATVIGVAIVLTMFYMIRGLKGFAQDNTMKYEDAMGKSAQVYLTIPGQRQGQGKVHVVVNQTLRELDAMTDGDTLPSGSSVVVVHLENSILIVSKV